MTISITKRGLANAQSNTKVRQRGHVKPRMPVIDLNGPGRLRTAHVLALAGLSHSTLYDRIKKGKFPKPDGRDGGLNYWNTCTMLNHLGS